MESDGLWAAAATLALASCAIVYILGWQRLREEHVAPATALHLASFLAGLLVLALALLSPLHAWSGYLLSARAMQMVLLCMIAPPLLWLGCPFQVMLWGLPHPWRRSAAVLLRPGPPAGRFARAMTQPGVAWLAFVSAFLLWHDPVLVDWTLARAWAHNLAPLLLFMAALLYWSHIVGGVPATHPMLPAWVLVVYLLGVEVPNMAAGVSIAFAPTPLYAHYVAVQTALAEQHAQLSLTAVEDQMIAGALVWVVGSLVYISAIVAVLNRLFEREGSPTPEPFRDWDSQERMIAPGLEHRVVQNRLRNVDLSHR